MKVSLFKSFKSFKSANKKISLLALFVLVPLILSACTVSTTNKKEVPDASVFLSVNSGDTWREAITMATVGQPQSIRDVNVKTMTIDPQDSKAVYLATRENGLYYTYNVVQDGWIKVKNLPSAAINDVKVDPKNKCIIYAAVANNLYRSEDCARTFEVVFYDNNTGVTINTIAIDHYNPRNVYIGTSRGEIIKTIDSGASWRTIQRLNEGIKQLIVSPVDSRLIFVASMRNKIYSFNTNSETNPDLSDDIELNFAINSWTDLNPVLKEYDLGKNFRDFVVCAKDGTMFIAANQAMVRSQDNGVTWEKIKLIQPEKEAVINSMAVNPQDSNNIFYVTNTTFFRSTDGGVTWTTKKLPTQRSGQELIVDFDYPNNLYLGTAVITK